MARDEDEVIYWLWYGGYQLCCSGSNIAYGDQCQISGLPHVWIPHSCHNKHHVPCEMMHERKAVSHPLHVVSEVMNRAYGSNQLPDRRIVSMCTFAATNRICFISLQLLISSTGFSHWG